MAWDRGPLVPARVRLSGLMKSMFVVTVCGVIVLAATAGWANAAATPKANPVRLQAADAVIERAIQDGKIPGAVLIVGHDGRVIYRKAYGSRSLEPRREPMTVNTIFDLASLTKVIVTTTAVMQLVEQGKVRLNDPVAKYLPEFAQNGKQDITVRQLLTHFSGLEPEPEPKHAVGGKRNGVPHGLRRDTGGSTRFEVYLQRYQLHRFRRDCRTGFGRNAG